MQSGTRSAGSLGRSSFQTFTLTGQRAQARSGVGRTELCAPNAKRLNGKSRNFRRLIARSLDRETTERLKLAIEKKQLKAALYPNNKGRDTFTDSRARPQ
jgi:hypothetical protein